MADNDPALKIRRAFERPSPELVAAFEGAPSGNVCDAMSRGGAIDYRIKPMGKFSRFVGVALTVNAGPRDNLAPWAALEIAKPGDVLVVATGEHLGHSVIGDVMVGLARNCGIVAVVTDGLVRDIPGIDATGLPVFARGVSPNSPWKNGPGEVGMRISLGGVIIDAGDILVGDSDGVAVVPRVRAKEIAQELEKVRAKEAEMERRVAAGERRPAWLEDTFAAKGIRYLD